LEQERLVKEKKAAQLADEKTENKIYSRPSRSPVFEEAE
jgi:hypothetical protein